MTRGVYQQNGDGLAEGIRTDQIPANQSPEFVRGYKRAAGSAAGFPLANSIENEYVKSDLRTNSDPKAFDSWFREQSRKLVTTDDPSVLRGVLPHVRQLHTTLYNRWQADVSANTKYQAQSGYGALAASTIDAFSLEGLKNRTGTDVDGLGVTLDQIRDKGFALGLKRDEIDSVMIDAITTKALEHRDPQILKLLDRESAAGPKLSDTPYGLSKKTEAVKSLTSLWKQQTTEERLQLDREDKAAATGARAKIADILIKDPDADIPDDLVNTVITRGKDGDFKINLLSWRENVRKGITAEDPKAVGQVLTDLLRPGEDAEAAFWRAVNGGVIKSPETMARARSFMEMASKANAAPSKILETAAARSYVGNIEMLGQDSQFSKQSILGIRAMTEGGRAALNDYRYGLMQWQVQNPGATPLQQEQFAAQLGETIVKGLQAGEQGQYQRPEALRAIPGASPEALQVPSPDTQPMPTPEAMSMRPPLQTVPAPSTQPMPTPEAMPTPPRADGPAPWLQKMMMQSTQAPPKVEELGLSHEEANSLNAAAQQRNAQPQEIINRMWRLLQQFNTPESRKKFEDFAAKHGFTTKQAIEHLLRAKDRDQQQPPQQQLNPEQRSAGPRTSIDLPGGLGQIHLTNLSPENLEVVRAAVSGLNLLSPRAQQASLNPGDGISGDPAETLSSKRIAAINALPVRRTIETVARRLGFDPDKAKVIASIESSGNPESGRSRPYKGLFQLNQDEWRRYGNGTDIHDAEANTEAGIKSMMDKSAKFKREFGREPSAVELYLMHQQGEAGLRAHAANPDQAAWKSMLSTGEGQRKGEGWAKRAIWGNVPQDFRKYFSNSVENVSSREFIAAWTAKMMGISYEAALSQTRSGRSRNV